MTPRHLLEPARLAGGALLKAQSDSRLVDLTRAGNNRAFEAIVARYKGVLLRYCSRILPDGRGEDAVQQSFVNAYRALHRDATPLSLRSWLFGIAHNVSLNILRQRGGDHEPLEAHPGVAEPAHVTIERRERFREVLAAVAALPPGQRDAIVLRELEGRGHEEIARELGVTGGAARQLISRARDGVRRAAAAVMPMPVLMRLTADTAPAPTADRLAELTAVGGGVAVNKVIATGAIGATLFGGAVAVPDFVDDDKQRNRANVAEAATPDRREASTADDLHGDDGEAPGALTRDERRATSGEGGPGDGDGEIDDSSEPGPGDDERDEPEDGDDDGDHDDDSSGPGPGDDDSSGPGPGDDDSLEEDDNSGPGSGDDSPEEEDDDSSGSGSGGDDDVESDHSGSGDGEEEPEELAEPDGDSSGDEGDSSGSGSDSD